MRRIDRAERTYLVTYDIRSPRRWRRVFRTMKGYGERLQLSVWHCRLDDARRTEMAMAIEADIEREEDHVLILDLGVAASVELKVESLGKPYAPIERRARIV